MTALTCPCPLGGNFSLPRGVCFILAAFHCNGQSGTACQVPLAQAEKIIPRTCCMPDIFCRMSRFDRNGKRQEAGVWVHKEGNKGRGTATYQSQVRHVYSLLWGREMIISAHGYNKIKRSTEPIHSVIRDKEEESGLPISLWE